MTLSMVALVAGLAGMAVAWRFRPDGRDAILSVVAVAGIGFQVIHLAEHVIQATTWAVAPDQPPFLTPWAVAGRDVLATDGDTALGAELLHLDGNLIFLVGLLAMAVLARRRGVTSRWLSIAVWLQVLHVVEHVALTATQGASGTATGATTGFGSLDPGPGLWALRVTSHFMLNALATIAAVIGVVAFLRASRSAPRPSETSTTPLTVTPSREDPSVQTRLEALGQPSVGRGHHRADRPHDQ